MANSVVAASRIKNLHFTKDLNSAKPLNTQLFKIVPILKIFASTICLSERNFFVDNAVHTVESWQSDHRKNVYRTLDHPILFSAGRLSLRNDRRRGCDGKNRSDNGANRAHFAGVDRTRTLETRLKPN